MGFDAPWHWVVVAVIVVALFGYKRMPDAARSLGRSLRIFKTEIKGLNEDDKSRQEAATPAVAAAPAEPAAVAAPAPATPPAAAAQAAPAVAPAEAPAPPAE